nr:cobalt transporter [Geobacter sp.]
MRIFLLVAVLWCGVLSGGVSAAGDKWPGVDETVVEKVARERGREARAPLINTDQGDLLLFVFLAAGAIGGFAAGYWWRMLVSEKGSAGRTTVHGAAGENHDTLR